MKKIPTKERDALVTKGFFEDYLDSKSYATTEYVKDMFEYYQSDMKHHIESLIEQQHDYFRTIIETLEGRFERNEEKLENLDNRVSKLKPRPSF